MKRNYYVVTVRTEHGATPTLTLTAKQYHKLINDKVVNTVPCTLVSLVESYSDDDSDYYSIENKHALS